MKNLNPSVSQKAQVLIARYFLAATTTGMLLPALTTPSLKAEPVPEQPHQVTPWAPLPRVALPYAQRPLLSSTSWTPIGPGSLQPSNQVSGRIAGIAAHPSRANTIY